MSTGDTGIGWELLKFITTGAGEDPIVVVWVFTIIPPEPALLFEVEFNALLETVVDEIVFILPRLFAEM